MTAWPVAVLRPGPAKSYRTAAKGRSKSGFDPKPTLGVIGNPIQHLEVGYTCAVVPYSQKKACLQTRRGPYTVIRGVG